MAKPEMSHKQVGKQVGNAKSEMGQPTLQQVRDGSEIVGSRSETAFFRVYPCTGIIAHHDNQVALYRSG
jgi:hypothetical protein